MTQIWKAAGNDHYLPKGKKRSTHVIVTVDAGTGNVQFQYRDKDGAWMTPTDAAYTVSEDAVIRIPRNNMPEQNITATGDAQFSVSGSID